MESISRIIQFINENWFLIVAAIAIVSVISIKVYKWCKMPDKEQLRQVQEWLLYAVAKAEEQLGSGTGELKLRYVYDMFMTKFPAVALFISFDDFCIMVEKALNTFEEMLKNNPAVGKMYGVEPIEKGEEENNE